MASLEAPQLSPQEAILFTMQTSFAAAALILHRVPPILSDNPYSTAMLVTFAFIVVSAVSALVVSHLPVPMIWKVTILQVSAVPILAPALALWGVDVVRLLLSRPRPRQEPREIEWDREEAQRITPHMLASSPATQAAGYAFTLALVAYSCWRLVALEAWFGLSATVLGTALSLLFPGLPARTPDELGLKGNRVDGTRLKVDEWVIPVLGFQPLTSAIRFKVTVKSPVVTSQDGFLEPSPTDVEQGFVPVSEPQPDRNDDSEEAQLVCADEFRFVSRLYPVTIEWDRVAVNARLLKAIRILQDKNVDVDGIPQVDTPKECAEWVIATSREIREATLEWIRTAPLSGNNNHLVIALTIYETIRHGGLFGKHCLAFKSFCAGAATLILREASSRAAQRNLRLHPSFETLQDVIKYTLGVSRAHAWGGEEREKVNRIPAWVKHAAWCVWKDGPNRWWEAGDEDHGNPSVDEFMTEAAIARGREAALRSKVSWTEDMMLEEIFMPWKLIIGRDADDEEANAFQTALLAECNRIPSPEFVVQVLLSLVSRTGAKTYQQIDAAHGACRGRRKQQGVVQTMEFENNGPNSFVESSLNNIVGLRTALRYRQRMNPPCCDKRSLTDSVDAHYDNAASVEEEQYASQWWVLKRDSKARGGNATLRIIAKTARTMEVSIYEAKMSIQIKLLWFMTAALAVLGLRTLFDGS